MLRETATAEQHHFWFRGLRWFVTPLVRRALAGVRDPCVLDCGCGTGANLAMLDRFGRVYGFDLSSVGLDAARRAGRTRVARARVDAAPFPDAAFDLVTSFDVLYALDDREERGAVSEMRRLLRPGGHLLVNVAAMDVLKGDHSMLCHEKRRYSKARLRRLLEPEGFDVVRLTYTNQILFLPMLAARTLQRARGLKAAGEGVRELRVPPEPVNALLSAALWLEAWKARGFDGAFGSSVLCLARRRR